jgi:hypothetical protein
LAFVTRPEDYRPQVTITYRVSETANECREAISEIRDFALRDENGNGIGVFAAKTPRQAALKVANRSCTDIKFSELGTKKLHIFTGGRVQADKP